MNAQTAWTEGLALVPQHFQNTDAWNRDALHRDHGNPPSRASGFTRIRVDEAAMENSRQFRILSCSGVFPGGMTFDTRDDSSAGLARDLPEGLGVEHARIRVYLAVPTPSTEGSSTGPGRTFRIVGRSRHDEVSEGGVRDVSVLLPNLTIRFSTEHLEGYDLLPVCEVVRDAQGRAVMAEDFVPLLLDVHASQQAESHLQTLIRALRARMGDLERQVPPSDPAGMRAWLETMHLRSHAAAVDHLAAIPEVHPERVHQVLATLWGGLAFLRGGAGATFPVYDHAAMPSILPASLRRVRELLETRQKETNLVRAMERESQVLHKTAIPPEFLASGRRFLLAVRSQLPTDQLVPLFAQHAKVASRGRLQDIITSALPGVEVRLSTSPDFFRQSGQVFFELVPSGPIWSQVLSEGNLCVYGHPALTISNIELLVEGG